MTITIHALHWKEMQSHVAADAPLEACGILAGLDGISTSVFPTRNLLNSPVRYQIQPQDQIRTFFELERRGWDFLAVYHSHPNGPPAPSPTDAAEAAYPETAHLIWSSSPSGWDCRAFQINYGKIVPIEIQRIP